MTTEDDFQRQLDASPDDHLTRLVFADWLDERNDPRAEGYRALGRRRLWPFRSAKRNWWTAIGGGPPAHNHLPHDWFEALAGYKYADHWRWPDQFDNARDNRREIEDAAALAFGKLPAERRAELLAAPTAPRAKRRKPARNKPKAKAPKKPKPPGPSAKRKQPRK